MITQTVTFERDSIQSVVLIYSVTIEELEQEFKNWIWGVKDDHDRVIDQVKLGLRDRDEISRKYWETRPGVKASDFFFVDALGKVLPRK